MASPVPALHATCCETVAAQTLFCRVSKLRFGTFRSPLKARRCSFRPLRQGLRTVAASAPKPPFYKVSKLPFGTFRPPLKTVAAASAPCAKRVAKLLQLRPQNLLSIGNCRSARFAHPSKPSLQTIAASHNSLPPPKTLFLIACHAAASASARSHNLLCARTLFL